MGESDTGADFYDTVAAFDDFEGFSDEARYRALPGNWSVVLADIRGSTQAIAEGRYKDVNMMGAACITAVLNGLKSLEPVPDIPYVFGGDGATLAVPPVAANAAARALAPIRALSEGRFGLGLRVGMVPVADLRRQGRDVRVAKFQLGKGNHLALFTGGGIELADRLIKDEDKGAPYRIDALGAPADPDLEGLSCRWQPIYSRRGRMVTVLVLSSAPDPAARAAAYKHAMAAMTDALGQDSQALSPVADDNLRFRWPPRTLLTEARATAAPGAAALAGRMAFIMAQSALQWVLHKTGGRMGAYDAPAYKKELIANTDFRRFDDMLRFVLDCSPAQAAALEDCLAGLRRERAIAYGLHAADTALMTCLVFSLEQSSHVHFVDGGDGGFAVAAAMLKEQLREKG